jgi:hypothetical protein
VPTASRGRTLASSPLAWAADRSFFAPPGIGGCVTEPESDAERRQRGADPFITGLTQHALETADTERLADLIEAFLASDNEAMRDAFIMGLARSRAELSPGALRGRRPAHTGSAGRPAAMVIQLRTRTPYAEALRTTAGHDPLRWHRV